jgi:N-acetylmuramoyl-L-alanine amidase
MAIRVLVQAGHVAPREPGIDGVGTTREQELALVLQKSLCLLLENDPRFTPVPVPGDIPDGIRVDAALFLHGDGSANQGVSGYCFGYPEHPVNRKLARLIGAEFDKIPGHPPHRNDNYTRDLAGYYGFRKVSTSGPEVLVEHGFLTNPGERLWLFANASKLAAAEYRALCTYFGLKPHVASVVDAERDAKRLKEINRWALARLRSGWTWTRIKRSRNWSERLKLLRRRGGR